MSLSYLLPHRIKLLHFLRRQLAVPTAWLCGGKVLGGSDDEKSVARRLAVQIPASGGHDGCRGGPSLWRRSKKRTLIGTRTMRVMSNEYRPGGRWQRGGKL